MVGAVLRAIAPSDSLALTEASSLALTEASTGRLECPADRSLRIWPNPAPDRAHIALTLARHPDRLAFAHER